MRIRIGIRAVFTLVDLDSKFHALGSIFISEKQGIPSLILMYTVHDRIIDL